MGTKLEAKLGIDYDVFQALNLLGKRNTFKHLDQLYSKKGFSTTSKPSILTTNGFDSQKKW
jgi:hypothetical protein